MIAHDDVAESAPALPRPPWNWAVLWGLTVVTLLPFITKPFNIDDPFYLAVAKHITESPLDFYGFEYNWYGTLEPVTYANHAPASAYFMALVGAIAGWSEAVMHTAFMIPAIAFVLGTYALANRLCGAPVLASVVAWFGPAVLVSATSVMTDVWMAAFFVWAVALWVRGIDESKLSFLIAAVAAASIAGLMKFFGVTVVGLLAVYAIGRRHPLKRWVPLLPIPILVLAGYEALTFAMYGQGLVSSTFDFAGEGRGTLETAWYEWPFSGLTFTGGGLAAAALVMLAGMRKRAWAAWGPAFVAATLALGFIEWRGESARGDGNGIDWASAIHLGAFVTAGALVLAYAGWQLYRERNAQMFLLATWVAGVFVFSTWVNWSVTARTFVPMAPAVAVIAVRAATADDKRWKWRYAATAAAACLALFVAWGDFSWSRTVRDTARMFNGAFQDWPNAVYFQGHWGFQYYADPNVMTALDVEQTVLHGGDIIISPMNNSVSARLPAQLRARSDIVWAGEGRWASTMLGRAGAGFYSNLFGPMPFRIGPAPPEAYYVDEVSPAIDALNRAQ